jgi:protein-S-isoprenylcysteine O-methyltransferase Ste14
MRIIFRNMHIGRQRQFRITLVKQLILISILLFVQVVIFLLSAGNLSELRPWFYFVTAFLHYVVSTTVQFKLNPELLVQRLKMKREGSKLWDEILMRLSNLTVIILIPIVAGLDFRFNVSLLESNFVFVGLISVFASTILVNWAMVVNPHFEPTVRIQKERDHRVVTIGPYNIVRHPGYLAAILFAVSIPFLIGSFLSFLAVGFYIVLLILRTWLEDKTLQEELEGYSVYVNQVKHRLFPKIWCAPARITTVTYGNIS